MRVGLGDGKLKPSSFNFFYPLNNDQWIVYNGMDDSISVIDSEMKEAIENGKEIPEKYLEVLKEAGVLIDSDIDESQKYEYMHNLQKYNRQNLGYTLVMTYVCNLRCPYCYEGQDKPSKHMDEKTADVIIKYIKNSVEGNNAKHLHIGLYGGEPLTNEKVCKKICKELYDYSKEKGICYGGSIITNGTLLNEENIKWMVDYNVKSVQLTLDGPKELHNRSRFYRDGRGTYDDILRNARLSKDLGMNPSFRISIDKNVISRVEELLDDLKERNLSDIPISFGFINVQTEACKSYEPNCLGEEEFARKVPELWRLAKEKGFQIMTRPHRAIVSCGMVTESGYAIDPFAGIYKCWDFIGRKNHQGGHINDDGSAHYYAPYYDILTRSPYEFEECRRCKYLPLCGGGCTSKAWFKNGTYHSHACNIDKYILEEAVRFYVEERYRDRFEGGVFRWKGQ